MKALFIAADQDGCGTYRCGLPAAALRDRGHEAVASTAFGFTPGEPSPFDVVVGQRLWIDGAQPGWDYYVSQVPTFFELDDDLFNVHKTSPIAYRVYMTDPKVHEALKKNMASATGIITTNNFLANKLREFNPNVTIIPNYVPELLLKQERPANERITIWPDPEN